MNNDIALVVTYFGDLPFWFPAFQLTCRYNPDVQWIIFSDTPSPPHCPNNVQFIHISKSDFCSLVDDKLKIKFNLSSDYLYKIVDFKPAFGLIYNDYLKDYAFWGHCDIDAVWGRIRHFITPQILSRFEIITSRIDRISGHFTIYKNNNQVNSIFMSMPWTKKYLENENKCMRLTEEYFSQYLTWLHSPTFLSKVKQLFYGKPYAPKIYWDQVLTTAGKHQRPMLADPKKSMCWREGSVYNSEGEEMMYLHFHVLKETILSIDFNYLDSPKKFYITRDQITRK